MTDPNARGARLALLATLALLIGGRSPLPSGWARSIRQGIRSPAPNRAEREAHAAGYYVGLIDGGEGGRDELTLRLLGKPAGWLNFHEVGATRYRPGDFLQFELRPCVDRPVFGRRFTTNSLGMRDREYVPAKPPGTFRIVLLGSSMDMGWGVGTDETYENRLEFWLNTHAARRGLNRRFEILNLAMAAYSPLHRLESFRRKARALAPDMVLYSETMLDLRLLQIHVCGLLQERSDLKYDFVRLAVARAGITPADSRLDARGSLLNKDALKTKLRGQLWALDEATLAALAEDCRSADLPLAALLIPRVSPADAPDARAPVVARFRDLADRHDVPLLDLSDTFDDQDPAAIEIASWDDHPNALGHKLLFRALARALVADEALYRALFGVAPRAAVPDFKAGAGRGPT
jgi:hypothetical protein